MIEYIQKKKPKARIVAIGNPPYQESDGGFGKSAKPIYHLFAEALIKNSEISEFALVIPSRWFGGGKGLGPFRENVIEAEYLKKLRHFPNSRDVFPTVDINGGICFFHWDKSHSGPTDFSDGTNGTMVDFSNLDIIPDDPFCFQIVDKVTSRWKGQWVSEVAWARKPFGLSTDYFKRNKELSKSESTIPCFSIGRKILYASLSAVTKNREKIDYWKVAVPKAAGGSKGKRRSTLPKNLIFLIDKGVVTTETYSILNTFDLKKHAENMIFYLKTDFSRYLLGLRKITQDIPRDRWDWVPLVDMDVEWTDEKLFDYFKLTKKEQAHIKKKVEEWS